jgi:hypothetical protein
MKRPAMALTFSKADFDSISKILGVPFVRDEQCLRLVLENPEEKRSLSLEIYPDIPIGKHQGNLISVYTLSTHLQLHFCSGYVVSDMLGEVTFVAECGGKLSGLIIERGAACSLYANLDSEILSGDFTQLGPEVMLSGIALSLTEHLLPKT